MIDASTTPPRRDPLAVEVMSRFDFRGLRVGCRTSGIGEKPFFDPSSTSKPDVSVVSFED